MQHRSNSNKNTHGSRQKILPIRDVDVVDYPRAIGILVPVHADDRPSEIGDEIVSALRVAIGNLVGQPQERHLVSLLRAIAPDDAMLVRIDALEVERDRQAATDPRVERQPPGRIAASDAQVG